MTKLSDYMTSSIALPADGLLVVRRVPLVRRHGEPFRHRGALQAHERQARVLPDGLRRIRPARRKRRHQERRPPVHVDDAEHREHAPAAALDGRDVCVEGGGGDRRSRVLQVEPMALPAFPGGGARLPCDVRGGLVPQRWDAGPRAGRGHGAALLAVRIRVAVIAGSAPTMSVSACVGTVGSRSAASARVAAAGTCGSWVVPRTSISWALGSLDFPRRNPNISLPASPSCSRRC